MDSDLDVLEVLRQGDWRQEYSGMPTIIIESYKFRFYSSDGNEPPHVHVLREDNEAKIWLQPVVVEYNLRYSGVELNRILKLSRQHQARLLEVWNAYFGQS